MKYFLDSAQIDEIKYAYEHWGIDGVTTNPKHIYASGKPFLIVIEQIARLFDGVSFPISVEVDPHLEKNAEIVDAATELAAMSENFVIKVACTEQGLAAAKALKTKNIETNITLVFSPAQAIQAGRIGAKFVSPFVGWKEANGENCGAFINDIVTIYRNYSFETEIIVAAVRSAKQIVDAAVAGAHIVTAGHAVYEDSFAHPFTDYGIGVFSEAWDKNVKETP